MGWPRLYKTGIKGLRRDTAKERKGRTNYYADFRQDRKRIRKLLGTDRAKAEQELKALRRGARAAATFMPEQIGPVTLERAQELWFERRHRPLAANTRTKYLSADRVALAWFTDKETGDARLIGEISTRDVEAWLSSRSKEVGPTSINRDLQRLRQVLGWCAKQGWIEENPCSGIKAAREPVARIRYLSTAEEEALKAACSPLLWDMVEFAINTGLRISEQLGLTWENIVGGQIRLSPEQTKSKRFRAVPLSERAREILSRRKGRKGLIWPSPKGKLWDRNNFSEDFWRPARDRAGLKDFKWHDLRHTFCSRLVMAGVDLYTVKELAGHSSIKMTERYAHLAPEHLKNAVDRLAEWNSGGPKGHL